MWNPAGGSPRRLVSKTALAQCITATRGRKVDGLARCTDQTCCAISSILRGEGSKCVDMLVEWSIYHGPQRRTL
jgi:hypothetical protein